jgi:methionyl-tRNA formyltransferase
MASTQLARVVYCGMFGALSRLPFAALIAGAVDLRAVIVPPRTAETLPGAATVRELLPPTDWSPRPVSLAALLARTIVELAWERAIPVYEIARFDADALAMIAAHKPDLIAVSCFPQRFPRALLALPPLGVLNVHPALLPRGRGPDPLFWAFRERDSERAGAGGVTVHLMDGGLDSGPIVAQDRVGLVDGLGGGELELQLAARGAALLTEAVAALAAGRVIPREQDEALATSFPVPVAADYSFGPDAPARWLFNFVRGTAGGRWPHVLVIGDRHWRILAARAYDPAATLPSAFEEDGETLRVRCVPGVFTALAHSLD